MATNITADVSLNIRELMSEKKISSEAEFARILGISRQSITKWKARNSYDVSKILEAFPDLSQIWLLTGEGPMLKEPDQGLTSEEEEDAPKVVAYDEETYESAKKLGIALIPEYNIIYHGGDGVSPEPEYLVAHWSIPNAPRGSYIITMAGNSMAPLLMSGAKLLVKPYYYSSALDIPFGDIFAIAVADEWNNVSTHIKVLRRHKSKEDTHWIARSINTEEYDDFEIEVGRVRALAIVAMDINQRIIL